MKSFLPITTKQLGKKGESLVADYLTKQGFTIIASNYLIKGGEIDIIASKENILTFVEVKTRNKSSFPLSQVITQSKQKKIIFTAKYFITKKQLSEKIFRFDVALVENNKITYITNAFTETNYF